MKILVVHEVSYQKKVIYEIHEFPELLALRGHEITFFDFDEGAKFGHLSSPRDREVHGRIHPDARIRLISPHRFGIPGVDRIWAVISSIAPLHRLIKSGEFDVILNYAVPTYGIQVGLLGKLYGVPVLQRALDVSGKIRKLVINPLIDLVEKVCFALATRISTNNPAMTSHVVSSMGDTFSSKIVMHYPPLDQRIFKETIRDPLIASDLGIEDRDQVVMYMGSFFYFSGLDDVLRQLHLELGAHPDLKLLLIGGGEQETELRGIVTELGIEARVVFAGFVPFHDLSKFMSLGDVAINPLRISKVAGAAFPHKVLQYMAVGVPTVSTKLDGLYAAFGDQSGIAWSKDTTSVLSDAIQVLGMPIERRLEQIRLQREVLDRLFSPTVTVNKLEETLLDLSRRRRNNA
jgi:glycosyltransferase involved in cell wall biosynthesis